jgi:hypothetical protein
MVWKFLKFLFMLPLFGLVAIVATSCTQLGLNYASLETANKGVAAPALELVSVEDWQAREAPELRARLEDAIFGPVPVGIEARIVSRRVVEERYLGGRGVLEELLIELGTGAQTVQFRLALATPKIPLGRAPLIIGQTFCDNMGVFEYADLSMPLRGRSCGMSENRSALGSFFMFIFGEYINKAPMEDYLERGYAYANFFAAEIVPDTAEAGRRALDEFPAGADGRQPTGAVAAWAAGYFAAIDLLADDPRLDADKIAVFGHSRHGKSALVAGAWDPRIKAVISHQSGTAGASLSRDKPGETVDHILNGHSFGDGYPHWFAPEFAAFANDVDALPVDQHALIALIAPRRVLLGNGRRDVWSDPNGAYRAAIGADGAWTLYGQDGLAQDGMKAFNPDAGIAYHLRPGGHGIVRSDVDAFLAFLEAGFAGG